MNFKFDFDKATTAITELGRKVSARLSSFANSGRSVSGDPIHGLGSTGSGMFGMLVSSDVAQGYLR